MPLTFSFEPNTEFDFELWLLIRSSILFLIFPIAFIIMTRD